MTLDDHGIIYPGNGYSFFKSGKKTSTNYIVYIFFLRFFCTLNKINNDRDLSKFLKFEYKNSQHLLLEDPLLKFLLWKIDI